MGETERRQAHGGDQQQLDCGLDRLLVHLESGRPGWAAGVVDDDVDAAEGFQRPLDEPLEIRGNADVAADSQCTQPLGLALQDVAPPGEHRDVRAFLRERFGDAQADAGRGAADDRRPSFERKVHGCGG